MPTLYELAGDPILYAGTGTPLLLSDGRILNWRLAAQSGRHRVRGDYFDANGVSTGQSFLTTHAGYQHHLVALDNGGVAIVYQDNDLGPGSDHEVYLTIYNAAGALVVESVQVNVIENGHQYFPDVAVLESGLIAITWMDDSASAGDGDRGIIARLFNENGTSAGGQFLVNTTTGGLQQYPTIVALPDGGFLIAWDTGRQLFDANGAKVGPERLGGYADLHLLENGNILAINGNSINILDPTGATVLASSIGPGGGVQVLGAFENGFVARVAGGVAIFDNMGVQQGSIFASTMALVTPGENGGFDYYSGTEIGEVKLDDGVGEATVTPSLSTLSETTPQNNLVATLSAVGEALNTPYTIELVSDSLGGGFQLIGNLLYLVDNANLDYETATTVSITVAATDVNGNRYLGTFDFGVTDETVEQRITASPAQPIFGHSSALLAGDRFVSLTAAFFSNENTNITGQLFDADLNLIKSFNVLDNIALGAHGDIEILTLPSGGFVLTWLANAGDGQGQGILARAFDADANPTSGVIVVNAPTFAITRDPDIVGLGSGEFLIAWEEGSGDGGGFNESGLRAQRFSAAGAEVGAEFTVNTTLVGTQNQVSLHPLASGGFLATWTDGSGQGGDNSQTSIKGQLFDSTAQKVGGEFLVNTTTAGAQHSSSAVTLASGQVLVTWASGSPTDLLADGSIRGQLFSAAGAPLGGEIIIQNYGGGQGRHEVAALPSGGFALAWTDFGALPDTNGTAVWARLFNADGSPARSKFLVNTGIADNQGILEIVLLPDGELYISWTNPSSSSQSRTFDLTGTRTDWSLDDVLAGTAGADTLTGGNGNDTYIVNHPGDVVVEAPGGGTDIIYSSISYSLNDGSEVESLSTITWENSDPINLTGNSLANTLIGNAGNNQLNGAGGADIMFGREGNDTYIVDNEADQAVEHAGQGSDIVYSAVSYALSEGSNVEALATLSFEGTGAINLTGNGLANTLIGNDGANQLDGRGGADVMVGRAGGDIYLVDHATDAVFENANGGYDVIYSAVSFALTNDQEIEGLSTITWELTDAIDLTGNSADNYLIGNAGSNVLDGKGGNDVLQGREGTDTFAFTTVPGAGNADLILDFSAADDTIRLEGAAFGGLAPGSLDPDAFVLGTAAQDGEDRIIYDQATGRLFFDSDGLGGNAAVLFATLQGAPTINVNDFIVS